jgi:hypothetical protein
MRFLKLQFRLSCLSLAIAVPLLVTRLASAQGFDAAAEFSATSNPNGAWSYGWSTSRLSGFHLLPQSIKYDVDITGVHLNPAIADVWTGSFSGDPAPSVFHNPAPFVDTHSSYPFGCCAPYPVGGLGFHPGPNGENAKVRWTAPASGVYKVKATFSGLDYGGRVGTTTDVAVLHSRTTPGTNVTTTTQLWSGNVIAFGSHYEQSFSGTVSMLAGDTIDFTVGFGTVASGNDFVLYPFANYYSDSTGLDASMSPEAQVLTSDLANLINGSNLLSTEQINRLKTGLSAITSALASGNNSAAIRELKALVGAVTRLMGSSPPLVPVASGEPLLADAIETVAAVSSELPREPE